MNDLDSDFKEKPKRRAREFPIDFVIPLQLEEIVHHFYHHPNFDYLTFRITQPISGDRCSFEGSVLEIDQTLIQCEGQMRRWEGISTRFEGKLALFSKPFSLR